MPWIYSQSTGKLTYGGAVVGSGYSGRGEGKNNPAMENVRDVGPIPQGLYMIGSPFDSLDHGPYAVHLSPDVQNDMFGRGGFLMHGDSIEHPGEASEGCIIMPRAVRELVGSSPDKRLEVIA